MSYRRKGDSFYFTVDLGRDVSGRKVRKYFTWKIDKRYTEKQLAAKLEQLEFEYKEKFLNNTGNFDGKIKFADFLPIYFQNKKNTLSPTVFDNYVSTLTNIFNPVIGHIPIAEIKVQQLQRTINSLIDGSYKRLDNKPTKPLAASSVQRYCNMLKSVFTEAYRLELIDKKPTDRLTIPTIQKQKTIVYDKAELGKMLTALDNEVDYKKPLSVLSVKVMFRALIWLYLTTGIRRCEATALKWSDIDFDNGTVEISKSSYKRKGEQTKTKCTKNGESRSEALSLECASYLKQWKDYQIQRRFELGSAWHGENNPQNGFVFTSVDGKIISPTVPTEMFSDFLERNNLPHIKLHALRHTFATYMLDSGVNVKTVSEMLGHSSLKVTNRYVHDLKDRQKENAEQLSNIYSDLRKQA